MTDYVLVGGGAFAREVHDWFTPSLHDAGHRFTGYLDDGDEPMRGTGHDLPQLGTMDDHCLDPACRLVMAVATPAGKRALVQRFGPGRFATLIHPTAWRSASATVGQGVIVGVFADISANAAVRDFATVNGYASVGHDATLGEFSTLSGYVDLTGYAAVGADAFVGSGARLLPNVRIGDRCKVGAGCVVVRSVGEDTTLFSAPAQRLRA